MTLRISGVRPVPLVAAAGTGIATGLAARVTAVGVRALKGPFFQMLAARGTPKYSALALQWAALGAVRWQVAGLLVLTTVCAIATVVLLCYSVRIEKKEQADAT